MLLKSLSKKAGYIVAAGIILASLLVVMTRLLTPILDQHRQDFEKWATQLLQAPVTIHQLRVSWYQYQPVIRLDEVTVLNAKTKQPVLQIQKIRIFFSLPQSIWQWKFVPSGIMLSGTDLVIHETPGGQFIVQGFPVMQGLNGEPYKSETPFADIMAWVSQQPHLGLQNINIRYTDSKGLKRFLTLYNLGVENTGDEHTILGKAILHQEVPTEVSLAIEWLGSTPDLAQIEAKIYLYISDLSLAQWSKLLVYQTSQLKTGLVGAKIWASWNHGAFDKIQTTFSLSDLTVAANQVDYHITRLSGHLGWMREGMKQIFAGDNLLLGLPKHTWPVTSFYLAMMPDANGQLAPIVANLGYLDLSDIRVFLPDQLKEWLTRIQLAGSLHDTVMSFATPWTDWSHLTFTTNFNRLSSMPWRRFPGVSNISGSVKWYGTKGDITLTTSEARFLYPAIFAAPVKAEQLSGEVHLQHHLQQQMWNLQFSHLQLLNHDLAANMAGSISIPKDAVPVFDLAMNFSMQNASHITRYLPLKIFNADLVSWLQQAFLGGEVKSGYAQLRGNARDFPFNGQNGIFKIGGNVDKIDLRYAPAWPILRQIQGQLNFTGNSMSVDITQAKMQDISIGRVRGEIQDLGGSVKPAVLVLHANEIQTDFVNGMAFIHASPLEKTLGKMFANVNVTGPMSLLLNLQVPLLHPDHTTVQGVIGLREAVMALVPWHLTVDHLNGQFQFTEKTTTANNITGVLFQKPFSLTLTTLAKDSAHPIVRATIKNNLSVTDLETWLKVPFSTVIKGETDVKADIDFALKAPVNIHLYSNLMGVSVDLPEQYAKKVNELRHFTADISVAERQPLRAKLSYGNLLSAALIMERKNNKFNLSAADISFGAAQAAWPVSSGLYISGHFNQLDWSKVNTYANQSGSKRAPSLKLRAIDIQVDDLNLESYEIKNLHLKITPAEKRWDIYLESPDIKGQIQAPVNFTHESAIEAQFQKLHFVATNSKQTTFDFNLKSLPSISLVANDLSYNNILLGELTFKTSAKMNGLTIETLRLMSSKLRLQASGDWTQANISTVTHLQGVANSPNVSALLNSFGFDVHNFISTSGKLNFNLNWRNPPYAPSLSSMNGRLSFELGQGRIVDIGQESGAKMDIGRMLSIFSLQSIPRRLSLDFSDVFQKGYSFDSIRGDFSLQNGDAYTSNMRIDGPVARVAIKGHIGLAKKNYNLVLSVTPYVTSTLPIAATLISGGNPVVGLAAFAVNGLIGSQVSKAVATYTYQVTGPWDNPNWKSVGNGGN